MLLLCFAMVCVISSALKSAGGVLVSTSGFSFMMIICFLVFERWEECRVVLSFVGIIDECFKVLCFDSGWVLRDRVFVVVGSVCEHLAKCVANTVVNAMFVFTVIFLLWGFVIF